MNSIYLDEINFKMVVSYIKFQAKIIFWNTDLRNLKNLDFA